MEGEDVIAVFESIKNIYRFDFDLKKEQINIIQLILNERHVFGLLPTGFGKSVCYILPPLMLDELNWTIKHVSIVVSPLKSLMADQVADLQNFNVSAIAIEPGTSPDTIRDIKFGKYSIIFMSPESATSPHWRNILLSEDLKPRICVFACDEAHCISEWGEDFRPSYKEVLCLRSIIEAPVLAITGTCDEKVKKDIFSSLALTDEVSVIAVVPDRPNIYLDIRESKQNHETDLQWMVDYISAEKTNAKKIIVYCRSVSATALLYVHFKDALRERGTPDRLIDMYHRSIDDESKKRILESFKKPDSCIRCLFATIAFGMGIQIKDIRIVVHWGAAKSCLSYWQEIGRAGRDGQQSTAICYAYGRSLTKQMTAESMISAVRGTLNDNKCMRQSVMDAMSIKEAVFHIQKQECVGCTNECSCAFCMCCNSCKSKCSCVNKKPNMELK